MSRILIVSDLHGNFEALEAALGVPHDEVVCLGDLVDYGPDPQACVEWARREEVITVRGNHDHAVAYGVDCGCGYEYKRLSQATREYTWEVIGDDEIKYLRTLPETTRIIRGGRQITLVHGSSRSMYDYIRPDTPEREAREMLSEAEDEVVFAGHTHQPMTRQVGDQLVVNPGSVGQPRDGDPRGSCAIYDTDVGRAEIRRFEYDRGAVEEKIKRVMPGEAPFLVDILRRGQ